MAAPVSTAVRVEARVPAEAIPAAEPDRIMERRLHAGGVFFVNLRVLCGLWFCILIDARNCDNHKGHEGSQRKPLEFSPIGLTVYTASLNSFRRAR
jgi:hypothetical protein